MKIVMVASEMSPYSKTGGLGDAISGLAKELVSLGQQVTCIVPYYRCSWDKANAKPSGMKLTVPIGQKQVTADIWETQPKNGAGEGKLQVILVRRDEYYDRSDLYAAAERDYEDNAERFIFLSKIAVEWIRVREMYPDIVHCHDWQTGLVPLFLRLEEQSHKTRIATKTVFTIHNIAYQGIFWSLDFPMTNLPWQFFTPDGMEFYGQMNLLKAGILFSDLLTTVSPKYAQEIQTQEYAHGLENPVRSRADRLRGILNGVDHEEWNPEADPHIAKHFSAANLEGKKACKAELLELFGLDGGDDLPLAGVISRLTGQKGLDIIQEVVDRLVKDHVRLVVLGVGEAKYEKFWRDAAKRYPKCVGVRVAFDDPVAHKIEAGCDLFLMPSRFEPCGLNQMYSLRYGTIPIVRATGGLDDTIREYDPQTGQGNGFKFAEYTGEALLEKCEQAVAIYKDRAAWHRLQANAMACDLSWKESAKQYLALYEKG